VREDPVPQSGEPSQHSFSKQSKDLSRKIKKQNEDDNGDYSCHVGNGRNDDNYEKSEPSNGSIVNGWNNDHREKSGYSNCRSSKTRPESLESNEGEIVFEIH
jgi:hypothetical protein